MDKVTLDFVKELSEMLDTANINLSGVIAVRELISCIATTHLNNTLEKGVTGNDYQRLISAVNGVELLLCKAISDIDKNLNALETTAYSFMKGGL